MADNRRPYAPAGTVIKVIREFRSRALPAIVDIRYLKSRGLSSTIAARVFECLVFLEILTEDGESTSFLRLLGRANDAGYVQALAGALQRLYADIFRAADPAEHPRHEVEDAFQRYEPASQHARMTMLFLGLCREAQLPIQGQMRLGGAGQPVKRNSATRQPAKSRPNSGTLPPAAESSALWGLIQRLPKPGSNFSPEHQAAWLSAMGSTLRIEYQPNDEDGNKS